MTGLLPQGSLGLSSCILASSAARELPRLSPRLARAATTAARYFPRGASFAFAGVTSSSFLFTATLATFLALVGVSEGFGRSSSELLTLLADRLEVTVRAILGKAAL